MLRYRVKNSPSHVLGVVNHFRYSFLFFFFFFVLRRVDVDVPENLTAVFRLQHQGFSETPLNIEVSTAFWDPSSGSDNIKWTSITQCSAVLSSPESKATIAQWEDVKCSLPPPHHVSPTAPLLDFSFHFSWTPRQTSQVLLLDSFQIV